VESAEYREGAEWLTKQDGPVQVWLNTTIDEALKKEGLVREVIRAINQARKEQGLTISDRVRVEYYTPDSELLAIIGAAAPEIQGSTLATELAALSAPVGEP